MVCGYLPFEDPKTSLLYKKILNAEYQIPDFVEPDCADLIRKILNTDPQQRITMPEILAHPWMQHVKNRKEYTGIVIGQQPIPYDQTIIEQVLQKCSVF
jgi:5'-AMP-activated protein kinase, catalytic alpha subunit